MDQSEFKVLADDALSTMAEIASGATQKLASKGNLSLDSFATGNTLNAGQAYVNLNSINQSNRESWEALQSEPTIARLLLEDEVGEARVIYIARKSGLALASGKSLASYGSPMGRFAELPVGEEASVMLQGKAVVFSVIEKTSFHPRIVDSEWDSTGNQYRHVYNGTYSIESLRALLGADNVTDADELDRELDQAAAASSVQAGISHQIRTAMGLRDQPILDQFQGEIFRLPLDSQLIILGPPGTGKTTTLIKRLGQKLDLDYLDEAERRIATPPEYGVPHANSWVMFTPSELLRHYLKEAFSREKIPASDAHIKTWVTYRGDIARNALGILRTANGGKYTFKSDLDNLAPPVVADPRVWFEAFCDFHAQRLKTQLKDGAAIVLEASTNGHGEFGQELQVFVDGLNARSWMDVYRDLDKLEPRLKTALDDSKAITDNLLKQERNLIYNRDKEVFHRLAKFLEELQQEDELDEEAEFDTDEAATGNATNAGSQQAAVKAYLGVLRTLARSKFRKRSMQKESRAAKVVQWLDTALPADSVLLEIGQRISYQNGLRRFVNAFKRYVSDVPTSYQLFRKEKIADVSFYRETVSSPLHLSGTELDAIVLLMLKNCRALLSQSFIERELDSSRYELLRNLGSLFKNQVMVDEATDFSVLQLSCMESLTAIKSKSFFACGDFNQRITHTGVRTMDQISWVSSRISEKSIKLVYRQSRALNTFAGELLRLLGGDLSAMGELPEESTHDGVKPVLLEGANDDETASWIAQRIMDVEKNVKLMPTVAVLVNSEDEVKPMAERLTRHLEEISLKAVACEGGRMLGEGTDIRVFDIQHIKGLEFEAVFFAGIDQLAEKKPKLFGRYLYVGTTRAATYLGITCYQRLPAKMQPLAASFDAKW